jgi:hypothetical protein
MLSYITLQAVCVGNDAMSHSEIDLNDHYANRNAEFVSGDNHFISTSRNLSLHVSSSDLILKGELKDYDHNYYQPTSVGLSTCIVNKNGQFKLEKQMSTSEHWAAPPKPK